MTHDRVTGDWGVELPPGVGEDAPVFVISVAATSRNRPGRGRPLQIVVH